LKSICATCVALFLLLATATASSLQQSTASGQAVDNSTMINGVLAHQMNATQAQLLANSNINWVSCDVTFNPSDLSQWSQVYTLAKQYHLSVMGILDQHLMNYSSFTLADWDAAVKQAVKTYGDVVKTWEIWNEPSLPDAALGYFNGSAQTYVTMLQIAYNDIKATAPADIVIGLGGLPLYTADNPTLSDPYSQQALVWANQTVLLGAMNYCDAIAVHAYPYGQYNPIAQAFFTSNLQQYSLMCNKPIWVTEVGQESASTTWDATESQQSTFLAESYSLFQRLGVKAYIWYELCDNYTSMPDSNFGLFDNNGNPKPAFSTYVDEVNGATFPTDTPTASPTSSTAPVLTATPSASPQPSLSPTQSPTTPPTSTPAPSGSAKPIPEENYTVVLTAAVATSIVATISIYLKSIRLKKAVP